MKIKKYLIIAVAPLLIAFAFMFIIYSGIEEKAFNLILDLKSGDAKQIGNAIKAQFDLIKFDLLNISRRKSQIQFNKNGESDIDEFYLTHKGIFSNVTRIDADGYILYSAPNKTVKGKYVGAQEHNLKIRQLHKPIISDVFDAVQNTKAIAYAFPIFKDDKFDGSISVLIPIDKLGDLILKPIQLNVYGHGIILTEEGYEIYNTSDSSLIGLKISDFATENNDLLNILNNMLTGKDGVEPYSELVSNSDLIPTRKWIIYQPVFLENTFWSIGIILSENELFESFREIKNNGLILIIISIFLFVGFISFYLIQTKRADTKLRNANYKYRIVSEQTGQIVYEFDMSTKKINWSGAYTLVTNYEGEYFEKLGFESFIELIHPEDRIRLIDNLSSDNFNKGNYVTNYRLLDKTGDYIYIEDNGVITEIGSSGKLKCYGTLKNVTSKMIYEKELIEYKNQLEKLVAERTSKLKEANQKLLLDIEKRQKTENELIIAKEIAETSDRLKTEFLAQVSHEIRTPINSILSFSDLIKKDLANIVNEDLKEGFNIIDAAGKRIIRTIDLILNMAEVQTNSYRANITCFDLIGGILKPMHDEFKILAQAKKVSVNFINKTGLDKILIEKDRYSLTQIFANLVDNAIKYTNEGFVDILLETDKDKSLVVRVNDTGIGMSEEYLKDIFSAFSQEEQGYTRKFEGNGLGLALVKSYCEINQVEIAVESVKGQGSSFSVFFRNNKELN